MAVGAPAVEIPFVGRVDELLLLRRLVEDAMSGRPRVVLLTGEAGVGKSRLLRELVAEVAADGVRVLEGSCHEGNAIPYLPVATAFRPIDHDGTNRLAPNAEATAGALARGEPEDHRLRLFLDATAALVGSAREQPTLLVIEDAQWADEPTADLLRHLVLSAIHEATVASLPLGVVLSSRGTWTSDAPRSLTRLVREGAAFELHLEQFGVADVHSLVRALAGARPDSEVTGAVQEATSGNPLLLRGIVERNLRARTLVVAEGRVRLAGETLQASSDLDDEIRHQIDGADEPTTALVTLAAVLGDDALESTLRAAAEPVLDVDAAIRQAVALRLISLEGARIRFTHPQIRHVLYEGLDPTTRAKAHLRVAEALETGEPEGGRALAIAHHLLSSGVAPPGERLARWTLSAGDEAWSAGAWTEALDSYTFALHGVARDVLDGAELAEVLLRTGVAAYYANDDSCSSWLEEAARVAEEQRDGTRQAEALLLRARFALVGGASNVGATPQSDDLEALLPVIEDDPSLHARVLATLSDLHFMALDHERATAYAKQAEAVITAGGAENAAARVHFVLGLQDMSSMDLDGARNHFASARASGDDHLQLAADTRAGMCALAAGQIDAASEALRAARLGERALSSHAGQQLPSAGLGAIAVLRGEIRDTEALAAEVRSLYAIQEYAFTPGLLYPAVIAGRLARGDDLGAEDAIREWAATGGRGTWRYGTLLLVHRGEIDAVARALRDRPWGPISPRTLFTLDVPCLYVEIGIATGALDLVRLGLAALREVHEGGVVFTLGWPWNLSRLIGDAHRALDEPDAARQWYERAERETEAAPLERALVELGVAQLEAESGDRTDAARRAGDAAASLDRLGLVALGARAAGVVADIGGAHTPAARDRYILFTDIVGSTELNVRSGDERYLHLIEEHDRVLRSRFRRHDGVEHAHTGDGMSAWFSTADAALACAFGLRSDLERASVLHPELPLRVRIGISAGQPLPAGERLFGLAVVESARVCALGAADQILVTDAVRAAAPTACSYRNVGEVALKGIPGQQPVFEAFGFPEG